MKTPNERKKFLEILEEIPNVSIAAKRACIAKSTIYEWRETVENFADDMDECLWRGRDSVTDLVESKLISQATKGEPWAMKYWLGGNCKRYVKPRMENVFFEDSEIVRKIAIEVITRKLTEDQMEKFRKENEQAKQGKKPTEFIITDFSEKDDNLTNEEKQSILGS